MFHLLSPTQASNPIARHFQEELNSMENVWVKVENVFKANIGGRSPQPPCHHALGQYRPQHCDLCGGKNTDKVSSLKMPK